MIDLLAMIVNENNDGFVWAVINEKGAIINTQTSTTEMFAKIDSGVIGFSSHKKYNNLFGHGNWKIEWIDDFKNDERIHNIIFGNSGE